MIANNNYHYITKQGHRDTNEDVELLKLNLTKEGHRDDPDFATADFFIICDGHGGSSVSKYVAPKLLHFLMSKNKKYPLEDKYIIQVCNFIQNELRNHPNKIAKHCGTTALVVALYLDDNQDRHVQIINIGDCRAVLSRNCSAIPLTTDHKPSWPKEKMRIDKVNLDHGTNELVHYSQKDFRIGDLSVSRAFGDLDNTPYVTHLPEIGKWRIHPADEFIIMACDGLWDAIRSEEAVNFVYDHYHNNHTHLYKPNLSYKTNNIAEKLAEFAIARGSTDNVSIIIIFFG